MERYQDYVIKDGQFVGKFEEMYQKFDDPWHQKEAVGNSYSRHATIMTIQKLGCKRVLEIGCGLGGGVHYLQRNCPECVVDGMDISETAIRRASEMYPDLKFFVGDLVEYSAKENEYDVIILSEIMWYILQDIETILANLSKSFKGKSIIINQTFYPPGVQKYGVEYFADLDSMIDYLPWKNICKMHCMQDAEETYESHSVFDV